MDIAVAVYVWSASDACTPGTAYGIEIKDGDAAYNVVARVLPGLARPQRDGFRGVPAHVAAPVEQLFIANGMVTDAAGRLLCVDIENDPDFSLLTKFHEAAGMAPPRAML